MTRELKRIIYIFLIFQKIGHNNYLEKIFYHLDKFVHYLLKLMKKPIKILDLGLYDSKTIHHF